MQTKLRPLGHRIVIERLKVPEQSIGGIFVLGREFPALGRVLTISRHRPESLWDWLDSWLFGNDVAIGDLVYFNRTATELREIPGEPDHFILDVDDLWVRIRD